MILTPRGLLEHSRTEAGRRMIRYARRRGVGVVGTQILIIIFYEVLEPGRPTHANLAATMLMSIPAFMLNKYWVWGKPGAPTCGARSSRSGSSPSPGGACPPARCALASHHVGEPDSVLRTGAVLAASIAGFGVLWVLKYLFLDKIMFGPHHHTPYDEDYEAEEAMLDARVGGATEV